MPTHSNPTRTERTAFAPYNFIPLPDRVLSFGEDDNPFDVDQGLYHAKRHTGWIEVTLTTRSPLFIRAGLSPNDYEQMERQEGDRGDRTPALKRLRNRPDFFHTGDPERPVVPGSSLRGMLRSLIEILGQGKLAFVTDEKLIYRAVADTSSHGAAYRKMMYDEPRQKYFDPRFEAGYLRQEAGGWYIQPAENRGGVTYAHMSYRHLTAAMERDLQAGQWHNCRQAAEVWIQTGAFDFQPVKGGFLHIKRAEVTAAALPAAGQTSATHQQGVLVRSGRMDKKGSEAVVYSPDPAKPDARHWIRIPDGTDPADPRDLISAYRDQVSDEMRRHFGSPDGALKNWRPVFYLMDGNRLIFFGHARMFRVPYLASPKDLLSGAHADDRIDLAEALFGKIKGRKGGMAGRVFVGDAELLPDQGTPWLPEQTVVMPRILSGPKPTTFQHYLTQDRPDVDRGQGLLTYNDPAARTTLRGQKRYWHQGNVTVQHVKEPKSVEESKDTQHTWIKPVRAERVFRFRIDFENLSLVELGALWWALALPGQTHEFCHSLGMGKPLGLGAVSLQPTLHLVDTQARYRGLFAEDAPTAPTTFRTGELAASETRQRCDRAVSVFEQYGLQRQSAPTGAHFSDLPRIQMLLRMMQWPGPDPKTIRYMEIERELPSGQTINEYRGRPVLPDPSKDPSRK